MKRLIQSASVAALVLGGAGTAMADPFQHNDDYNYTRLVRWEQHVDQRIADGVRRHQLRGNDGWRLERQLADIEIHTLESYYNSNDGIDDRTFWSFANQLRDIGRQLGDSGWFNQGGGGYYGGGYGGNGGGYGGDNGGGYSPPPPPPHGGNYYREGQYESDCHRGNAAAGTIFGAIAGGLIGSAASHGNGGAIAGGVILGGLAGNALSQDIDCDDQHDAYTSLDTDLNDPVGQPEEWHHNNDSGTFTSTRDYRDGPYECRDFHSVSYRNGQRFERDGTACRQEDGYWHLR
jgi:surface antigen